MTCRSLGALILAPLCAPAAATAGGGKWVEDPIPFPRARDSAAMAVDPLTGEVVLFGGNSPLAPLRLSDTWIYRDGAWTEVSPPTSPGERLIGAMAPNPGGGVVLFGGIDTGPGGGTYGDTWVYAGGAWTEILTPVSPAARYGHGMAYDPHTETVYLYGGFASDYLNDTWAWDGENWSEVPIGFPGPARTNVQLGARTNGAGLELVLFGGYNFFEGGARGDTWVYTGGDWLLLTPATSPAPRSAGVMITDPTGDVLLFGGSPAQTQVTGDTWRWNGTTWTPLLPTAPPGARASAMAALEGATGHVVLFGGRHQMGTSNTYLDDTWRFDGSEWSEAPVAKRPPSRSQVQMTYDATNDEIVLFGGWNHMENLDDTWTYGESVWTPLAPDPAPPARSMGAFVHDDVNGNVVLFGGSSGAARLGDTWTWNGATWTPEAPAISPPSLYAGVSFFDPATSSVIVHGGSALGGNIDETWSWDGSSWSQLFPATAPPARFRGSAAVDAARGNVVLFGGFSTGLLGDTWIWDGVTWTDVSVPGPQPRRGAGMAYGPDVGGVLLFGGTIDGGPEGDLSDTWLWDGAFWLPLHSGDEPIGRHSPALVLTPTASLMLFSGSSLAAGALRDVWFWKVGFVAVGDPSPFAAVGSAPRVRVSPTPARSHVTLRTTLGGSGPVLVELFDVSGRRVHARTVHTVGADLELGLDVSALGFAPGTYFTRIVRDSRSAHGRLVVR